MPPTLFLIEANDFVRLGFRSACSRDLVSIVGEASGLQEATQLLTDQSVDVVLLDADFRDEQALAQLQTLIETIGDARVIVWSDQVSSQSYPSLLRMGVAGLVDKTLSFEQLFCAITSVAEGRYFFCHPQHQSLLKPMRPATTVDTDADRIDQLSIREREVLGLLSDGMTNKQIAEKLFLSVKTIETYRARLMKKLDVRCRAGLTTYARQLQQTA
ncbi:response regulator transcription factor [Crateriforma conspicua]|uniref:response regulator transcription factor n=1 Tax=Crateriforma conspicua TaxID=2527996 RepID=UPI00118CA826|nr:response regulator transcription factor [Crateriforma conspicua]QDV62661.1 Putative transcriptional regulator [Crateriforma conspicua]